MSAASPQPFVWVGVTALIIVAAVVVLSFVDDTEVPADPELAFDAGLAAAIDAAPPPTRRLVAKPSADAGAVDHGFTPKHASERTRDALAAYREQVEEDQRELGDAYADMDKLWKQGRYGGASPAAIEALEKVVRDYGDTHRAACARYLLAKHAMRGGAGKIERKSGRVTDALESLAESNEVSRCDSGARVHSLSKFFLATQIYRHNDWDRSVEVLEELAEIDPGEVDGLGVPLSLRARGILQEVEQMER